jgi:hypothetical protein
MIKVNEKYIGVFIVIGFSFLILFILAYIYEASGGGAISVIPIGQVGRQPSDVPLIYGHQGKVTDLDFSPFNSVCFWLRI